MPQPQIGQSRWQSMLEAGSNIAIGYLIAVGAQYAIFPAFGIHVSHGEHFAIAGFFTIVSIIRSYALRRFWNMVHCKQQEARLGQQGT